MPIDANSPIKIDIELKADITKAAETLATETPKGISKITQLLFGKRDADVSRYKMLTAVQTQRDCALIISGQATYSEGRLMAIGPNQSGLSNAFIAHESEQEIHNVAGNVKIAIETLRDIPNEHVSDKEVDQDFFARWRREAKVISNKELQLIWGRLLAEEVKSPNSISYRTLDVIKNITPQEASTFLKVIKYIIDDSVLPCDPQHNSYPGDITTDNIILLDECGLITNSPIGFAFSSATLDLEDDELGFFSYNNLVFIEHLNSRIEISGLKLSSAGVDVLKICDRAIIHQGDHFAIAKDFLKFFLNKKYYLCAYEVKDKKDKQNFKVGSLICAYES